MNRRNFLSGSIAFGLLLTQSKSLKSGILSSVSDNVKMPVYSEKTKKKFSDIIKKAQKNNWNTLTIGECIGEIGKEFIGIPYAGGTLEAEGQELCRINFEVLDCVTFFENTLCLARIIKKEKTDFQDLTDEITFTRYRNGKITDYTSRLHYTADWIYDNSKKKTIFDVTNKLGGRARKFEVSYMSTHYERYDALVSNRILVPVIAETEKEINSRVYYTIKKEKIKTSEAHFKTGDIVAITSNVAGLDYAHTGLIYKKNGKSLFMHASSSNKKVIIDCTISEYVRRKSYPAEITILRPLSLV